MANDEQTLSARQEAGLVEEDFEQQPADEAIAAGEHVDWEAQEEAGEVILPAPSATGNPYMSQEEQNMEMTPQVMGPPQYGSPDPTTAASRLLPLSTHPLNEEFLPEGNEAAVSQDYGQDVQGITHSPTDTSHSIVPPATDLDANLQGRPGPSSDYEELSKADLLDEARQRGLDVNTGNTKAEIIEALEESDTNNGQ